MMKYASSHPASLLAYKYTSEFPQQDAGQGPDHETIFNRRGAQETCPEATVWVLAIGPKQRLAANGYLTTHIFLLDWRFP